MGAEGGEKEEEGGGEIIEGGGGVRLSIEAGKEGIEVRGTSAI